MLKTNIVTQFRLLCLMFLFCFTFVPQVYSAPNSQINYQGKLTNSSDVAVADGPYEIVFRLYTVPTGGSAIWTETLSGANEVTVQNGLFSVMLGSTTALSSVDFNQTLYLGVTIEADAEMSPRKVLGTVPAAFEASNANTVGGVASTSLVRNDQANTISASSSNTILSLVQNGIGKILSVFAGAYEAFTISSSGNVGIGSSTPSTRLSVVGNSYFGGNVTATGTIAVSGTATFATTTISSSTITTLNLVNALPVSSGGTGLNTYATGDLVFASGANTLASRAIGSTGSVLSVVGGIPTWSATSTLGFSSSFTSSAQLAALLSDETGTGNVVFSNSPLFSGTVTGATSSFATANANFIGAATTTQYGTEALGLGGQLALNGNSITNTSGSTQSLSFSSTSNLNYTGLSGGSVVFTLTNSSASNGSSVGIQFRSSSIQAASIFSERENSNDNNLVFYTRGGGTLSERMRINPNGNLSIGTTSSSSRLTVDGTLAIFGTSTLATTTITNLTLAQALAGTSGGTGLSTTLQNQILIGGAGNTWTQVATSSLGLGNGTFLGLADTPSSYTANAIPFATSTANQLIFSNKFQFNGQHLGVGGATFLPFSLASTTTGTSLTLDAFVGGGSSNLSSEILMRSAGNGIGSTAARIAHYNTSFNTVDERSSQITLSREDADNTNPNGFIGFSTMSQGLFAERLRLTSTGALGLLDITPEFGIESLATSSLGYFGITNVSDGDIFAITSTGNVGIGSTSPSAKLTVAGTFLATGTSTLATTTITDLSIARALRDTTNSAGTLGMVLQSTGTSTRWVATSTLGISGGGASTFLALTDTPGSFNANRILFTNSSADALTDSANFTFDGARLSVPSLIVIGTSTFADTVGIGATSSARLTVDGQINVVGTSSILSVEGVTVFQASTTNSNYAIGESSLRYLTTGSNNFAVGFEALYGSSTNLMTGFNNIAIGLTALYSVTSGNDNLALGAEALYYNTEGIGNTALGNTALFNNINGNDNIALGTSALFGLTTGNRNIALGNSAGNSAGSDNIAIGSDSLAGSSGSNNIAIGQGASENLITGSRNTIIGYYAEVASSTASNQLSIGNLIFGNDVNGISSTLSTGNIGIGSSSPSSRLTVSGSGFFGGNVVATGTLAISGASTLATTTTTDLSIAGALRDTTNSAGTLGMVLQSTGTSTRWVATSTLGISGGSSFTTSADLAALLSNETGSAGGGLVVFSNAPTFTGTSIFANSSTTNATTTNATTTNFAISGLTSGRVPYLTTGGRLIDSANFTFDGSNLTLGTDVSLSRGAANRLDLATGDSLNLVLGGIAFNGTTTITASTTNRSYTFGELAGATFTNNTTDNIAIGFQAGRFASTTNADNNIYIGDSAGRNNTGNQNVMMGFFSGSNNTGNSNLIFGNNAGSNNTGFSNLFQGAYAGFNNTGAGNTIVGSAEAGQQNKGNSNNFIGGGAGYNNAGSYNSSLGIFAGANNTGSYSEFIGFETAARMSASSTVALGSLALRGGAGSQYSGNLATTTNNIAIGYGAGYNVQTGGNNNLLLGYQAADSLTTGANNIIIGYDVEAPSNTGSNQLNIGNLIFSNGINGTGTVLSTGNIGIGSTSPSAKLTVAGTFLATGTSTLATTTITDLSIAGVLRDTTNSAGTLGMVLQSTGTSTRWVATSTLGISGGSSFTTSADLAALLSDETGSAGGGLVVFSNAPTFTGTANFASTTNSGRLSVLGTSTLATTSISGLLQMGTTSVASRFNLDVAGFNTAGTAGLNRYYTSTNAASGTVQFGESGYLRASVTATSTIVGSMFRVEDSTTFGNTIRGLEVQTNRGTNTRGENTALSGFARTFGVRGFTSADAGGVFEPAGGYFETGGTTQGNAIRGYSASITSASLASLFQDTSTFSGTGLQMNLGNGSGSFTGKFLDLQVAGVSKFSVASTGATLVLGDLNINATNTDPADNNVVGMYFGTNGLASINRSAGVAMNLGRSNDGSVLEFYSAGAVQGGVSIAGATVSYNAFTGSHFGLTNATTYAQGTVLTLTGENESYNNDPDSEILYGMTESSLENDPKVVGTYLSVLEPALPESTSNPTLVMAVGNGHMWVADQGEDIEVGDYLISSDVAGHAEKDTQSADMSYVIARASEAIDWDEVTETTIGGVKHKKITIFFENFDRPNLNLAQLASSTFDLTELTDETPTERFLTGLVESLVDWFGNAQNGIGNMYANVFNASERICVDGECLDANDIRDLKEALQNGGSSNPPPANNGGGDSSGDSGDNGGASTDSGDGEGNEGGDSGGEEPPPGDGGEGTGGGEDTGGSSGDSGDGSGGDGGN